MKASAYVFFSSAVLIFGACAPPPAPIEVVETTIAQIQDAITSGRTTCRMVVQSYLDRIEAYDQPTGRRVGVFRGHPDA